MSKEDLFSIPPVPIPELEVEQVWRLAQVVDTALFKAYLLIRPTLVGSLCRLSNYCEVAEVEGVLREKKVRRAPCRTCPADRRLTLGSHPSCPAEILGPDRPVPHAQEPPEGARLPQGVRPGQARSRRPSHLLTNTATRAPRRLSKDETELEDKLEPSVRYLHALGPAYTDLVCQTSKWIFHTDFSWGMKVRLAVPRARDLG